MYCNRIITNVEHWVGSKQRRDSFFLIDVGWNDLDEVLEQVGESFVDVHSMWRLLEWHSSRGDIKEITILVSLDGKFLVVADRNNLQHIVDEKTTGVWPLNPEGDGIHGTIRGKFRPFVDLWVQREPQMAHVLGYKPKPIALKSRISFAGLIVHEFDPAFFGVVSSTATATDANLALAFINPRLTIQGGDVKFEDVMDELAGRLEGGMRHDETWYKSDGLTMAELEQRRMRANHNLEKLEHLLWAATNRALEDSDSLPHRFWASDFELVSFLAKFKKFDEAIELYIAAATHPDFSEGLREIVWDLVCRLDDSEPPAPKDADDF